MLQVGSMGRELTMKNIALFAEQVLPRLHEIHEGERWENHWWPERLGGVPLAGAAGTAREMEPTT
jgi:hypothetical protein